MNCWIILWFLLCGNQNGRGVCDPGCGCEPVEPPKPPCRPRERECDRDRNRDCDCNRDRDCGRDRDCDRDRDRDCNRNRDCDCDRAPERESCPCNNDSRFEPRFDARPFGNAGCGCDDK